jgi:hypothetical protein
MFFYYAFPIFIAAAAVLLGSLCRWRTGTFFRWLTDNEIIARGKGESSSRHLGQCSNEEAVTGEWGGLMSHGARWVSLWLGVSGQWSGAVVTLGCV